MAIDPRYTPALVWAAFCHRRLLTDGWAEAPEETRRKALDLARTALERGEDDPQILVEAAFVLAYFGEDLDSMVALVERALTLNPSFARGWYVNANLRLFAGDLDIAIEHAERSERLNPREPIGSHLYTIGMAYFFKRRFEEAAAKLLLLLQDHPGASEAYRVAAACCAHMGKLDEARSIIGRLRRLTSEVEPTFQHWRNPEHRELFLSGLRLAMGEARWVD
jgi:adenylate cyclase